MKLSEIFGLGPLVVVGFVIDGEEQLMYAEFSSAAAAREAHEHLRARIDVINDKYEP